MTLPCLRPKCIAARNIYEIYQILVKGQQNDENSNFRQVLHATSLVGVPYQYVHIHCCILLAPNAVTVARCQVVRMASGEVSPVCRRCCY